MEWYTLDNSLRRETVIEGFKSFIWAERYFAWGDIKIQTKATRANKVLLKPDVRLGMKDSDRVMKIESVQDDVGEDGTQYITVTGREIVKLLDERVAMPALSGLETTPKWIITGTPGYIARYIFEHTCVNSDRINPGDTIPFYHPGTLLPAGSIPEPSDEYIMEFDPDTVYNDIKKICEVWSLGFRLVKNGDAGEIYFEIYTGDDRTSGQTDRPVVIFSLDLETISKVSTIKSTAELKTVAYVFAKTDALAVYADGYDSSVSGSDRRVVLVKADDIDLPAGAELTAAMIQRGREELAKYRDIYALDGEIPQHQPYIYGVDYNLGDLVEERSPDGFANYMLVTEQIFISDEQGERSYPGLMVSSVVTPGSWKSRPVAEHWGDVDVAQHWNDA
jgi:Siphovirus ReqiPepy6 Gp37-like protein